MKVMVYERKVDTRDELLQQTFDAARRFNGAAGLPKVTLSAVERVRMGILADCGQFEHLLN
jgi:hypothetical protein